MFIANALYFKESWLYTFEDEDLEGNSITGDFTFLNGNRQSIDMMQLTSSYIQYKQFSIEGLNGAAFEVVKIPYKNRKFQMKIILPAGKPEHLSWLENFTALTFLRDQRTDDDFNLFKTIKEEEFDGVSESGRNRSFLRFSCVSHFLFLNAAAAFMTVSIVNIGSDRFFRLSTSTNPAKQKSLSTGAL